MRTKIYITGTSRGLGKALAIELLKKTNTDVVGIGRECSIEHKSYEHYTIDLSNSHGLKETVFENESGADCIVLINNAGTLGEINHVGNVSDKSLEQGMFLNLTTPVVLINRFLKTFSSSNKKLIIINISSGAAWNPYDGWGLYCASKAGLEMYAGVVDKEFQINEKNNFRIFSVSPGVVDTSMQDYIRTSDKKGFSSIDKFVELKEKGALQEPSEVASKIIKLIENPEKYRNFKIDIADLKD